MRILFNQQTSGNGLQYHTGVEYSVEPIAAKKYIAHGVATLVSGQDEVEALAGVPFAEQLYAAGITKPEDINVEAIATMQGFSQDMAEALEKHLKGEVKQELPVGTPFKTSLELAGIKSANQYFKALSQKKINCLNHEQIIEVSEFLEAYQVEEPAVEETEKAPEQPKVIEEVKPPVVEEPKAPSQPKKTTKK